jgi:hypothetical protein
MKKKDLVVLRYRKIDDARTLTQQPSHHGLLFARLRLATCELATLNLLACRIGSCQPKNVSVIECQSFIRKRR